jgi:hypothetical protein
MKGCTFKPKTNKVRRSKTVKVEEVNTEVVGPVVGPVEEVKPAKVVGPVEVVGPIE